jgi:hypothetical protein
MEMQLEPASPQYCEYIQHLLLDLSDTLSSDAFAQRARHPDHPHAFTRSRLLPLPALVAVLLCMRSSSQQCLLDTFFGRLCGDGSLVRAVSDRAFAQARTRLHAPALSWLNDRLVAGADAAGLVPRWQGLRLVAADASVLMPAVRRCHLSRSAAGADQRLFALYLPAAELTLHAAVHSGAESERAMLVQALDKLAPDDVLLLDRGYPAAWLINLLNERGVRFIMRCDTAGSGSWPALRAFMRGDQTEAVVRLSAPKQQDANDWGCSNQAPTVRLVRNTATGAHLRVLLTNLPADQVPAGAFGALYHQRWRIEEAFKRLEASTAPGSRLGFEPARTAGGRGRQGAGRQHRGADVPGGSSRRAVTGKAPLPAHPCRRRGAHHPATCVAGRGRRAWPHRRHPRPHRSNPSSPHPRANRAT